MGLLYCKHGTGHHGQETGACGGDSRIVDRDVGSCCQLRYMERQHSRLQRRGGLGRGLRCDLSHHMHRPRHLYEIQAGHRRGHCRTNLFLSAVLLVGGRYGCRHIPEALQSWSYEHRRGAWGQLWNSRQRLLRHLALPRLFDHSGDRWRTTDLYGIAGNGYFATWLSLVFSTILVIVGVPPISSVLEPVFGSLDDCKKMMLAIFLASIIDMWHAARICDTSYYCEGMLAWGVAAGAASAGLILIFALLQKFVPAVEPFTKFFALFLALWWLAAVCSLTMPNNSDCDHDDYYCKGLFLSV